MSDVYPLLHVDLTISTHDPESVSGFERMFQIHEYTGECSIDAAIAELGPALICFDFDFPTKRGLHTMQETKRSHPSVPIVMLTVQHSESLAVWAFRSRVWDYLVKPVGSHDIERCCKSLAEMFAARSSNSRKPAMTSSGIPVENRWKGPSSNQPLVLAPAVEYVEKHYGTRISADEAAHLCGLTTFQLSRQFKETYGITFKEYIIRYRIRQACRLLANPNLGAVDVAHMVGFTDPSYFGKVFRRYLDCTPSEFQASGPSELERDVLEITSPVPSAEHSNG